MTRDFAMRRMCTRHLVAFVLAGSALIVALAFAQVAKAQFDAGFGGPGGGGPMMGGPGGGPGGNMGGSSGGFGGPQGGQGMMGSSGQGGFGGPQGGMMQGGSQGMGNQGFGGPQGGQGMMGQGMGGQGQGRMGGSKMGSGEMGSKMGPGGQNGQGMMSGRENGMNRKTERSSFEDEGDEEGGVSAAEEKRTQREEERQKKMEEQQEKRDLAMRKKNLGGFVRMAAQMKTQLGQAKKRLEACGLGLPQEFSEALGLVDEIVVKIKAAQTIEALEEVESILQEKFEPLKDGGEIIGENIQLCEKFRQLKKEVARLEKDAAALARKAAAKKNLDLSGLVSALQESVTAMKQMLAEVETLAKTDPDAAIDKLESDLEEQRDNYFEARRAIEMALNIQRGLKEADRWSKDIERRVKRVQGKKDVETSEKIDTSSVEESIGEFKQHLQDIRALIGKKGFDPDELTGHIEAAFEMQSGIEEEVRGLEERVRRPVRPQPKEEQKSEFDFEF